MLYNNHDSKTICLNLKTRERKGVLQNNTCSLAISYIKWLEEFKFFLVVTNDLKLHSYSQGFKKIKSFTEKDVKTPSDKHFRGYYGGTGNVVGARGKWIVMGNTNTINIIEIKSPKNFVAFKTVKFDSAHQRITEVRINFIYDNTFIINHFQAFNI